MAEAKTGMKKGRITPGNDVNPRYLAGSTYANRVLRNTRGGGGSAKKLGKTKLQRLASAVPIDKKGYTVGGWSESVSE